MLYSAKAPAFRFFLFKKAASLIALAVLMIGTAPAAQALRAKTKPPAVTGTGKGTSLLGSYLAGHIARAAHDSDNAALYYRRALALDPSNEEILDEAFQLELASGNYAEAKALAERLVKQKPRSVKRKAHGVKRKPHKSVAHIFLGAYAFRQGKFHTANRQFRMAQRAAHKEDPAAKEDPTIKLARAWAAVALGRVDKAIASLRPGGESAWITHFETVQRAFIADAGKRKAQANEAYSAIYDKQAPNQRIAEAYARHLAHWGKPREALAVLEEAGAEKTPIGKALVAGLKAGKRPKLMVANVKEGLAESFLGIGQVLAATNGIDAAQIYFRFALMLNPQSDIAKLELAELYGNLQRYAKAISVIDKIPEPSPVWANAQMRKALYLNSMKKDAEAAALLGALLEKDPDNQQLLRSAALIESGRKKYEKAIGYYNRAIELLGTPEKKDWQLFYSRGVAYERSKQWQKAEPDFKKSLELDPEQGATLNYLGYSWLDQNMNIPEAFDMIKKAVKLRPNDGYIIDSLGWAYYLQKDYERAVKHLDKAVELRPEDPTLNDHLGDVYWRLGRKLEAKYQWTQALSLNPEPEDAEKIKKKLEVGLPDDSGHRADLGKKPAPGTATPGVPAAKPGTGTP